MEISRDQTTITLEGRDHEWLWVVLKLADPFVRGSIERSVISSALEELDIAHHADVSQLDNFISQLLHSLGVEESRHESNHNHISIFMPVRVVPKKLNGWGLH